MGRAYSGRCGAGGTVLWPLGCAAALLLLTACASDDGPPRGEGPRGERFGGDGEGGRPSLFVSPAGEPFRAPPGQPYPVGAWFRKADADGDGKLTRDEFVADAARFFAQLDTNHDGVIDGFELKAYETEVVPEIVADRGGPPGGGQTFRPPPGGGEGGGGRGGGPPGGGGGGGGRRRGGGGGGGPGGGPGGFGGAGPPGQGGGQGAMPQAAGAAPYGLLGEREPVAGSDLDLNSRITLANFKTRAGQRFALLDEDRRGYLVLPELPKTAAQRQAERRSGTRDSRPPG